MKILIFANRKSNESDYNKLNFPNTSHKYLIPSSYI